MLNHSITYRLEYSVAHTTHLRTHHGADCIPEMLTRQQTPNQQTTKSDTAAANHTAAWRQPAVPAEHGTYFSTGCPVWGKVFTRDLSAQHRHKIWSMHSKARLSTAQHSTSSCGANQQHEYSCNGLFNPVVLTQGVAGRHCAMQHWTTQAYSMLAGP